MATLTFYLQQVSPAFTPATMRGAWDDVTTTKVKVLGLTKSGVLTNYQPVINSVVADWDFLLQRFISDPLAADTAFSGIIDGVVGLSESNALLNAYLHLHIFVLVGATDVLRGTLLSNYIDTPEISTVTTTGGQGFSATMTGLQAYAGDTVVVELGVRCSADVATYVAKSYNGGTGVNLADGGDATVNTGWIRLAVGAVSSTGEFGLDTKIYTALISPITWLPGAPQMLVHQVPSSVVHPSKFMGRGPAMLEGLIELASGDERAFIAAVQTETIRHASWLDTDGTEVYAHVYAGEITSRALMNPLDTPGTTAIVEVGFKFACPDQRLYKASDDSILLGA